jgi:hypothetical protein
MVWLQVSTIGEILDCIVKSRQRGADSILCFHWQANQVHDLRERLDVGLRQHDQPKLRRFDYDYKSETVYLDIMTETKFHYQIQAKLRDFLHYRLLELAANLSTDDPETSRLINSIAEHGTGTIEHKDKLYYQPDVAYGPFDTLPSLVCEVS